MEYISSRENGIIVELFVQPGSKVTRIEGLHETGLHEKRLKVKIAAKAVDGAANANLCAFMSRILEVSKSSVTLLSGEKSRLKKIFIKGNAETLIPLLKKSLPSTV
jgi:uncharacterized protein (TIGR00251 family)